MGFKAEIVGSTLNWSTNILAHFVVCCNSQTFRRDNLLYNEEYEGCYRINPAMEEKDDHDNINKKWRKNGQISNRIVVRAATPLFKFTAFAVVIQWENKKQWNLRLFWSPNMQIRDEINIIRIEGMSLQFANLLTPKRNLFLCEHVTH